MNRATTNQFFVNEKRLFRNGISYRDMSKDVHIQQMKVEIMALQTELETNHPFGEIIGKTKKMHQLFTQIQTAAAGDITVLIQGETGTGKELVAKSIHDNSPRKAGPFVAVNCAAIPEGLIESELFGHDAGLSPGQPSGGSGSLKKRTPAHFFSMKLGICNYLYKRGCCVYYKNGNFKGSVAQTPSPLIFVY